MGASCSVKFKQKLNRNRNNNISKSEINDLFDRNISAISKLKDKLSKKAPNSGVQPTETISTQSSYTKGVTDFSQTPSITSEYVIPCINLLDVALNEKAISLFIDFLMGQDLLNLRQICKLWKDKIDTTLLNNLEHIINQLKVQYKGLLEPVSKHIKPSLIYSRPNDPRIDFIVTLKIVGGIGLTNNIGYKFRYKGEEQSYVDQFCFNSLRNGSSRVLFFERDESTNHMADIEMPTIAGIQQFCMGDYIKIPFNLHNAYSTVDISSIEILPSIQTPHSAQQLESCLIDSIHNQEWEQIHLGYTNQQKLTDIMKNINTILKNEDKLAVLSAEHGGYDVATLKLRIQAHKTGKIDPKVGNYFAHGLDILPSTDPVTGVLIRKGLIHDLYSISQGDIINFYLQTRDSDYQNPACVESLYELVN